MKTLVSICLVMGATALAGDWPQWQGPARSGVSTEDMPALDGLKLAWEKDIGFGFAGISTANGRAYTLGNDGKGTETLYCLDVAGGKEIWRQDYAAKLMPKLHVGGPNATPLIADGKVYSLSKDGQVQCRAETDGSLVWKASLLTLFEMALPPWGFASSPQLVNGQLLLSCAKTVALNPADGAVIWVSDTQGKAAYSTPSAFTLAGKPYAAVMTAEGVSVISLGDGKTLASYRMSSRFNMIAATPLILPGAEGEFFVATSHVAARLRFDGKSLTPVWTSKQIKNKLSNSKLIDGYLYGVDGGQGKPDTQIVCMDAKSGDVAWIKKKTGHGSLLATEKALCFLSDAGELISFAANPKAFEELGHREVLSKICWTEPTLSNGRIFVRNDKGRLICLAPPR
jgi:outer membrane protein assembly factor BamB